MSASASASVSASASAVASTSNIKTNKVDEPWPTCAVCIIRLAENGICKSCEAMILFKAKMDYSGSEQDCFELKSTRRFKQDVLSDRKKDYEVRVKETNNQFFQFFHWLTKNYPVTGEDGCLVCSQDANGNIVKPAVNVDYGRSISDTWYICCPKIKPSCMNTFHKRVVHAGFNPAELEEFPDDDPNCTACEKRCRMFPREDFVWQY